MSEDHIHCYHEGECCICEKEICKICGLKQEEITRLSALNESLQGKLSSLSDAFFSESKKNNELSLERERLTAENETLKIRNMELVSQVNQCYDREILLSKASDKLHAKDDVAIERLTAQVKEQAEELKNAWHSATLKADQADELEAQVKELKAKETHLCDVYDSLGLKWGDDPFAKIKAQNEVVKAQAELVEVVRKEHPVDSEAFDCPICDVLSRISP